LLVTLPTVEDIEPNAVRSLDTEDETDAVALEALAAPDAIGLKTLPSRAPEEDKRLRCPAININVLSIFFKTGIAEFKPEKLIFPMAALWASI
jgi:hypothetical protein